MVLVAADALVVDRVLEGALIVVERADPDLAGLYFRAARLDPRRLCVLGAWQYSVKIRVVVKTKLCTKLIRSLLQTRIILIKTSSKHNII